MKKLTVLLLALAICLGLTACASADEKALEAANALLEAGDYEAAMAAYQEIPIYQEISKKVDEAGKQIVASAVGPYVGTWMDLNSDATLTVNADGTVQVSDGFGNCFDNEVGLYEGELALYGDVKRVEIDGVTHLKDTYNDFVPQEDYARLGAKTVELTLENWETYFEIREAKAVNRNGFGEIEHVRMGYGIFLRDAYVEKLENEWDSVQATFRVQFEEANFYIEGDYPEGEWHLGQQYVDPWYQYETREEVVEVWPCFFEENAESDFNGHYVADMAFSGVSDWDAATQSNKFNVCKAVDPVIVEVSGTLSLFP